MQRYCIVFERSHFWQFFKIFIRPFCSIHLCKTVCYLVFCHYLFDKTVCSGWLFDAASTKREEKIRVIFEKEDRYHKILRRQDKTFNESKPIVFQDSIFSSSSRMTLNEAGDFQYKFSINCVQIMFNFSRRRQCFPSCLSENRCN